MVSKSYIHWVMFVVSLGAFIHGYMMTISGLLVNDISFRYEYQIESEGYENFALKYIVILFVGELFGCLLYYPLADYVSRRTFLLIASGLLSFIILWNCVSLNANELLFTRFLVGVILGVLLCVAPVYLVEIAAVEDRGASGAVHFIVMISGCILAAGVYSYLLFVSSLQGTGIKVSTVVPHDSVIRPVIHTEQLHLASQFSLLTSSKDSSNLNYISALNSVGQQSAIPQVTDYDFNDFNVHANSEKSPFETAVDSNIDKVKDDNQSKELLSDNFPNAAIIPTSTSTIYATIMYHISNWASMF